MSLFQSGELLKKIESQLTLLSERMKTFTAAGLNTDAKLLEPFAARLLNRLFTWQLTDPASGDPTHKAFDLADPARGLAIQVSVQDPPAKIKHTLAHITEEHRRTFSDIRCFFLLHWNPKTKPALPVITIRTLLDELKNKDPDTLRRFLSFLENEITNLPTDTPSLSQRLVSLLHQHRAHPALSKLRLRIHSSTIPAAEHWEGRAAELPRAAALLEKHHRLAVTGPGGIGKTAFCARLVSQLPQPPRALLLHDFYAAPGLDSFIASVLHQAGLRIDDPDLQPAAAARVLAAPGLLLYIEGAEKLTTLTPLLQFLSPGTRLLLTTRRRDHLGTLHALPLTPLSEPEAASLIHRHAAAAGEPSGHTPWPHPATSPGYTQLARDLGCLPLACRLAGIHCGKMLDDGTALHAELTKHGLQTLLTGEDSRENLELLFSRTAARLASTSPASPAPALLAWQLLTLGGTHPTPLSVLHALGLPSLDSLRTLVDYGLATPTLVPAENPGAQEPAYALTHALLATWARTGLAPHGCSEETFLTACQQWGLAAKEQMINSGAIPGGEPRYRLIVPLAENLLALIKSQTTLPPEQLHSFYYFPARAHDLHASFHRAEALYGEALARMETSAGPTGRETANALSSFAQVLMASSRFAEAEPLLRRALDIDEASFADDHPNIARDLNNLAGLLKATNRLEAAEPLMRRALAMNEACFGKDHPDVARDLNNLAMLLTDRNRLAEAEPMMRRALAIDEATFDNHHPNVSRDLNNLGRLLWATNRLAEAEPLVRRALAIQEANYGNDHPGTALRLSNLAALLMRTNRLAEAEPLLRRALDINEAKFGKDHPKVAGVLIEFAGLLRDTNRLAEAEPLIRRALAIDEANLGKDHPNVARDINGLTLLLQSSNRFAEAEPLIRRALAIDEASFGKDHPNVAIRLNNLAMLLKDTNRLAEAEPLMRRALAIDEASFGKDHPNVARDVSNLAQLLKATKRLAEAEPLMRRALAIDEASFGKNHPDVAIRLNNLAVLLYATNRLAEAEPLMRRQLEILVNFAMQTGYPHPLLQTATGNYAELLRRMEKAEAQVREAIDKILGKR